MQRPFPTSGRWRHRRRGRGDRGAALVEFALIAMPLFLILFGTIEFGWAFFQLNDVRHGAREGIRLVAVDADPTPDYTGADMDSQGKRLLQEACERMDQSDGVWIQLTLTDLDPADSDTGLYTFDVGDDAKLVTKRKLHQLTNMFAPILDKVELNEDITTRLEQDWYDSTPSVSDTWQLDTGVTPPSWVSSTPGDHSWWECK